MPIAPSPDALVATDPTAVPARNRHPATARWFTGDERRRCERLRRRRGAGSTGDEFTRQTGPAGVVVAELGGDGLCREPDRPQHSQCRPGAGEARIRADGCATGLAERPGVRVCLRRERRGDGANGGPHQPPQSPGRGAHGVEPAHRYVRNRSGFPRSARRADGRRRGGIRHHAGGEFNDFRLVSRGPSLDRHGDLLSGPPVGNDRQLRVRRHHRRAVRLARGVPCRRRTRLGAGRASAGDMSAVAAQRGRSRLSERDVQRRPDRRAAAHLGGSAPTSCCRVRLACH